MNVPAGWHARRFDELGTIWSGSTPSSNNSEFWDGDIVWITPTDLSRLNTPYIHDSAKRITERGLAGCSTRLLPPGSVVLSSRAPIGYIALPTTAFCTNQGCKSIELDDAFNSEFVYYAINFIVGDVKRLGEGTTFAEISKKALSGVELVAPNRRAEQNKIAEVLSTVDRAIAQTEALIAKQQRIKTGLMQDLLTRGIDEAGQLRSEATHAFKDSPLGRIPVEWESATVGSELVGIDAGKSPDCPDRPAGAGEWGVLKVSAVQPDGFLPDENKVIVNPVLVNPAYEVRDGDLLISRSNTFQLVGIVSLVVSPPNNLMLCDKTLRLRFNSSRMNTEFMFWVLQQSQIRRQIELNATGTSGSMKNISQSAIRSLKIKLPSFEEQQRIVNRIRGIQAEVATCSQHAKKLRHLKTALMQDLLTGKVRVTPLLQLAEATST